MPPPAELANSIGVGVALHDEGQLLPYVEQVLSKMQAIKNLASATSVSIKVTNQYGGPGGGGPGQGQEIQAESRVRRTKAAVQEETKQLNLLTQIEEEQARRAQATAHDTTDYLIGEGRRATGALKAQFEYEEGL